MTKALNLYRALAARGPGYLFMYDDEAARMAGCAVADLGRAVAELVAAGVVEGVAVAPGTISRVRVDNGGWTGPRRAFRLTGRANHARPRVEPRRVYWHTGVTGFRSIKLEPRVKRTVGALPRWRSIGAWLLGDPPIGRSALDQRRGGMTEPRGFDIIDIAKFA